MHPSGSDFLQDFVGSRAAAQFELCINPFPCNLVPNSGTYRRLTIDFERSYDAEAIYLRDEIHISGIADSLRIRSMTREPQRNVAVPLENHERPTRLLLITLGLFVFVVAVYTPSSRYGFQLDEQVILFRMVPPRTMSELVDRTWAPHFPGLEYFRPVPHATYLVQYMWDRNGPAGFHMFNAIMMGLTACVAFVFLQLPCFQIRRIPAALAAALFAVHPASSSSVIPIVGRETMIAACLTIAAVYAFFRGGRAWYVASLVLLALALLSKEQAAVIPILFVLGDSLGLSHDAPGRNVRRWLRRYAPAGFVLIAYLAIRWSFFSGTEYGLAVVDRPFGPLLSVGYALQTVFTPFGELAYEPALAVWLSRWRLAAAGVMLVTLVWAVTLRCRASRAGALFWLGWFLVTIAPTANLISQQAPYSERYVLLAILAVVAVSASVVSTMQFSSRARFWTALVGLTMIAASAGTTIHRGKCFENELTFYRQWVRTNPSDGQAQMRLGIELYFHGQIDEAADRFSAGARCEPISREFCRSWLGKMMLLQGRFAEAEQQFQLVLDQDPRDVTHLFYSGVALRGLGDRDKAIDRFERALEVNPRLGSVHFLLADTQRLPNNSVLSQAHRSVVSESAAINLSFSGITDSHLRDLSEFSNLRSLSLHSTLISDAGLVHLKGMMNLNRLWMPGTAISNRGVSHLRDLPNLNSLVLMDTRITDDAVADLVSMRNLKHLDVRNTGITRKGFQKLKSGLPECLIYY